MHGWSRLFLACCFFVFGVPALMATTFVCKTQIRAFDEKDATKQIGSFLPGTSLEVSDVADANGMVFVSFKQPNGDIVDALCHAVDVGAFSADEKDTHPFNCYKETPAFDLADDTRNLGKFLVNTYLRVSEDRKSTRLNSSH